MYKTYILYSKSIEKYYTGSTQNLENRLQEHNTGETPSIKNGIPWEIVWQCQFETRTEALLKEKKIKSRGAKRFLDDIKELAI